MTTHDLSTSGWPLVIAHRGVSGRALENSLGAFALAVTEKCDGVELDIHLTADDELVVHHDPALPTGEIIAATALKQLRRVPLKDGSRIPLLAEVLEVTANLRVYIEAKTLPPSGDDQLFDLLESDRHPERLQVHSFDHRIISRLARRERGVVLGVLSASWPVDPAGPVIAAGARTLWQEWSLIDAELMGRCGAAGVKVIAWTVNSGVAAQELATLGVEGLCGNYPERLRPSG